MSELLKSSSVKSLALKAVEEQLPEDFSPKYRAKLVESRAKSPARLDRSLSILKLEAGSDSSSAREKYQKMRDSDQPSAGEAVVGFMKRRQSLVGRKTADERLAEIDAERVDEDDKWVKVDEDDKWVKLGVATAKKDTQAAGKGSR